MLIRLAIALAALSASAAGFAGEGQAPVVLKPSTSWYLDYAEGYCRLARQFGTAEHKALFYLEQYEPDNRFKVLEAGPDFAIGTQVLRSIRFGPEGAEAPADILRAVETSDYGPGVSVWGLEILSTVKLSPGKPISAGTTAYGGEVAQTPATPGDFARISFLEMLDDGQPIARLELGGMIEPVNAMNACTNNLLTHWGIDFLEHQSRRRAPVPMSSPATWISNRDYPPELWAEGREGIVQFRVNVDQEGKATSCHIQQVSRPNWNADELCRKILGKARFYPALNAEGKPMRSYWRAGLHFGIPH